MKITSLFFASILIVSCTQNQSNDSTVNTAKVPDASDAGTDTSISSAVPGPVPNTIMTEQYVKSIGQYAYLWGWPMVNIYNRNTVFAKLPAPGYMGGIVPVAPANQIGMLTDYIEPEERVVACPNQDVVYGFALLDFTKDAIVVQVPDIGDRFWVYQVCDSVPTDLLK